jgi:hypothetical protein
MSFCTSSPTSPGLRSFTPANTASRRCRFWRRMTSGLKTSHDVGHAVQRDRRAVLGKATGRLRNWSMRSR